MVLTDDLLAEVEQEILNTLNEAREPYAPKELIDELTRRNFSDEIIRRAIWYLVDRKQIRLTPEFRFAALEPVGAGA
jgi:hypothetical protein